MQAAGLKGFHLSLQQARLWLLQGDSKAYRAQCLILIEGALDVALFLQALEQIVNRHAVLRTGFYYVQGMEVPVQVVANGARVSCPAIDLVGLDPSSQETQLHEYFSAMQELPFALKSRRLLYVAL